jgi:hypothetical protein
MDLKSLRSERTFERFQKTISKIKSIIHPFTKPQFRLMWTDGFSTVFFACFFIRICFCFSNKKNYFLFLHKQILIGSESKKDIDEGSEILNDGQSPIKRKGQPISSKASNLAEDKKLRLLHVLIKIRSMNIAMTARKNRVRRNWQN